MKEETLEDYIASYKCKKENQWGLAQTISELADKHGFKKDSQIYSDALISKQTWSNVMSEKTRPSQDFLIKVSLVMHLDEHECMLLLDRGGYYLDSGNTRSLIIRYCIKNKIYSIADVDDMLKKNKCEPLTKSI